MNWNRQSFKAGSSGLDILEIRIKNSFEFVHTQCIPANETNTRKSGFIENWTISERNKRSRSKTKWMSRIENLTQNDALAQNQLDIHFVDRMEFESASPSHYNHRALDGMQKRSEQTEKSDEQRVKLCEFGTALFEHLRDNAQKVWSAK
jgi:hypothetical protein